MSSSSDPSSNLSPTPEISPAPAPGAVPASDAISDSVPALGAPHKPGPGFFYGYINSAVAGLALLFLGGAHYLLPALSGFMKEDLGWSAAAYGGAFSVYHVIFGFGSIGAGVLVGRFGPRKLLTAGAIVLTLTCGLLSLVTGLWQFYVLAAVFASGVAAGAIVTGPQLAGNWLYKRRGTVIGMLLAVTALGGSLLTMVAERVMDVTGSWRPSWLVIGGLMLIALVAAAFFVRNRPEDLGQKIDGVDDDAAGTDAVAARDSDFDKPSRVHKTLLPWTMREAVSTPSLWMLVLVFGMCNYTYLGTLPHQVSYLTSEAGMSANAAAGALALMIGFMAVGKTAGGWLADRIEPKRTLGMLCLSLAAGLSCLLFWHDPAALYIYAILLGVGYGGSQGQTAAALANYYGGRHIAAILGLTMGLAALLGSLSTWLTGFIRDRVGSYEPAFIVMLVLITLGAVLAFLTPIPKRNGAG